MWSTDRIIVIPTNVRGGACFSFDQEGGEARPKKAITFPLREPEVEPDFIPHKPEAFPERFPR